MEKLLINIKKKWIKLIKFIKFVEEEKNKCQERSMFAKF
jgi:hypothetical protein